MSTLTKVLVAALENALQALYNVPEVGKKYDQQHSDTQMAATLVINDALKLAAEPALPKMTTLSIEVNKFDDWGQVIGTHAVEMTQAQIADVIGHAAQLIAVHRAVRRSSGDMEGIIAELDEAMYATDVMENIKVHAEQKPQKPTSGASNLAM